jgi:hypothetical protein
VDCVLTISGRNFNVDAFLARYPQVRPTTLWRRGEPRHRRPAHADSGFTLASREASTWEELRQRTMKVIEVLAPVLERARRAGAEVGFDFALYVGARPFTTSASFSTADMRAFLRVGADVTVSAYPVAEEEPCGRRARGKRITETQSASTGRVIKNTKPRPRSPLRSSQGRPHRG